MTNYGVYISGTGVFNAPVRDYNAISVPGRNGDLLGNEKKLDNIDITYPAFVYANFRQAIADLKAFLLSQIGYQRLTDTYYPDEFRLGYYEGGTEIEPTGKLDAGSFDLTFKCKPQRYLTSGETVSTYTADRTINNPTLFDALPLIRAYGTGTVGINDISITINQSLGYTDIDCELMDAFYETQSRNNFITVSGVDFPSLKPGVNQISVNGLSKVEITPRWWRV